ncbi:hypothetical protein M1N44_04055 [Dehalococcoidia bacterium]|nr:hypothetical protein [Dehalococcoidia bacterium]
MGGKRKVKEKLKYVPLASKLLFLAIAGAIVYREREDLHRFCRYPFPFIMCPYGLLFAFFNKTSFLKIKLGKKGCTGRTKCLENCTTGKPLSKLEKGFDSMECVRCYDCVLSCPEGAVKIKPRISK